jgi:hypothetical protein
LLTALAVIGPFLGQIELTVQQGMAMAAGIGQKDPDLDISMRPAVPLYWRATPADRRPFLRKPVSSMTTTASASPK